MFLRKKTLAKHLTLGELGEKAAAKYLEKLGHKVLEFNYKNNKGRRVGEIDIISFDKKEKQLVFVEVKTRILKNGNNNLPEENINRQKLYKLQKIAQIYLKQKRLIDEPYRFDAVSVWLTEDHKLAKIKHLPSIFI